MMECPDGGPWLHLSEHALDGVGVLMFGLFFLAFFYLVMRV